MKNNKGFTAFGIMIMISIFLSIAISVLSMAVNLHKTSIHKMEFIENDYMLKTSLIYPETIIKDYYKIAFYNTLNSLNLKYQGYDEELLFSELLNIQKDYKRYIRDELYQTKQIEIYTTISKLKLDECSFRITEFGLDTNKNIAISIRSSLESKDITNSHTGEYVLEMPDLTGEDLIYIISRDFDYLWGLHKTDFKKEKDYVSY